jgi:molecular chaperone GrpE (heat shock protein)
MTSNALQTGYSMTKKQTESRAAATAAEIERSIQALNKMAERLWGEGREAEAKALLDALDSLNRALDRIRIGESRRVVTLH